MTRRLLTMFLCAVTLQLAVPTEADAWWEYIEALSGPKLNGPHIEGRVLCFMEERDDTEQTKLGPRYVNLGVIAPCAFKIGEGDRRRASIDVGMRYLRDRNPETTNGEAIRFTTVEPVLTWNPIQNVDRDVVDLGIGAGMYWFSSKAFPSFRGAFLEPLRVDVHLPTSVRSISKWMVLVPTARVGVLLFPAGFEPNAFAGPGRTTERIPGEAAKYFGFFFDLEALYN